MFDTNFRHRANNRASTLGRAKAGGVLAMGYTELYIAFESLFWPRSTCVYEHCDTCFLWVKHTSAEQMNNGEVYTLVNFCGPRPTGELHSIPLEGTFSANIRNTAKDAKLLERVMKQQKTQRREDMSNTMTAMPRKNKTRKVQKSWFECEYQMYYRGQAISGSLILVLSPEMQVTDLLDLIAKNTMLAIKSWYSICFVIRSFIRIDLRTN